MENKIIKGIILITCLPFFSKAQTMPDLISYKTPDVSSINKFIETPVSTYTGVADISIPLYEINIKGVSVPITINYNAGGIRTDEEATWVGLGWSLSYGGQISRKVKGKPDEYSFFYAGMTTGTNYSIAYYNSLPGASPSDPLMDERQSFIYGAKKFQYEGVNDLMPDEFYYNIPGYSGRFMYHQSADSFVFFPHEDLTVSPNLTTSIPIGEMGIYAINSWTMVRPDGIAITLGSDGITKTGTDATTITRDAWMIKQVANTSNEQINYTYSSPINYSQWKLGSQSYSFNSHSLGTHDQDKYNFYDINVNGISFPNGYVSFQVSSRNDMPTNKLDEIDVVNLSGETIRKIHFYYSYFWGNQGNASDVFMDADTAHQSQRLRLDSVSIINAGVQPETYIFTYNTSIPLPSKQCLAQDYWGFYNGQTSNNTLVPLVGGTSQTASGSRKVDPTFSSAFSLNSITYPTGGKAVYTYESNTSVNPAIPTIMLENLGTTYWYTESASQHLTADSRLQDGWVSDSILNLPDSIGTFGEHHYRTRFVVPITAQSGHYGNLTYSGYYYHNDVDAEGNPSDETLDCYNNNIYFNLWQLDTFGHRVSEVATNAIRDCSASGYPPIVQSPPSGSIPWWVNAGTAYELETVIYYWGYTAASPTDTGQTWYENFYANWLQPVDNPVEYSLNVGGLRLKEIDYYNYDGALAKQKKYSYNDPVTGLTTGQLLTVPVFAQNVVHVTGALGSPSASSGVDVLAYGNPVAPLNTTSGTYLGYSFVTETTVGDTLNEVTTYTYSNDPPNRDENYNNIDEGVYESQEWKRGKLLSKQYYKYNIPYKKENYSYYTVSPQDTGLATENYVDEINTNFISLMYLYHTMWNEQDFYDCYNTGFYYNQSNSSTLLLHGDTYPTSIPFKYGLWTGYYDYYLIDNTSTGEGIYRQIPSTTGSLATSSTLPYFQRFTGFDKMKSKQTYFLDDYGNTMIDSENYFYDKIPASYELTRIQKTNSKGEAITKKMSYPTDYASLPYTTMVGKNMVNYVVTDSEYNNGNFVQSFNTNYNDWGGGIIAPQTIQATLLSNPTQTRMQYYGYDNNGNPLSMSKDNSVPYSYIWDYNGQYPIAKVANAASEDIAYTSFESTGSGNWTIGSSTRSTTSAITGNQSYSLSLGNISKSGLTSTKTYIVSYWSRGGSYTVTGSTGVTTGITINGWTYYEHLVTGLSSVTISGTNYIDELRLYPQSAQMTTSTYNPLVGISSMCDAASRLTYYNYDALGRLTSIMDQNGNIVKKYTYAIQQSE